MNSGGKRWETRTDEYGDFWLDDLPVGLFDLSIQMQGYQVKLFEKLRTRECVNLGDIPLERA